MNLCRLFTSVILFAILGCGGGRAAGPVETVKCIVPVSNASPCMYSESLAHADRSMDTLVMAQGYHSPGDG